MKDEDILYFVDNYFFTQNIIGRYNNNVIIKLGLRAMSWMTLDMLPVWLLLYIDNFYEKNHIYFRVLMSVEIIIIFIMGVTRRIPNKGFVEGVKIYYKNWRSWALFPMIFLPAILFSIFDINILNLLKN